MADTILKTEDVMIKFGGLTAVSGFTIEVERGSITSLIGPNGAGKTTLLKSVVSLVRAESGGIHLDGTQLCNTSPRTAAEAGVRLLPSEFRGIFSSRTVLDNLKIAMPARMGRDKARQEQEIAYCLEIFPDLRQKLKQPAGSLSGGQQQRIGVIRALANDPDYVLLDEPFSALDPLTRSSLQDELSDLHRKMGKTMIFVTHDMDEAIKLADRICVIQAGHVVQCDNPEDILKHPVNRYVEEFIGKNKLWSNPEFVKAEDIMLKRPVQATEDRSVVQAIYIMSHYNVDSLLVTDNGRLKGIVWLADLRNVKNENDRISNYISDDYISVFTDTSLKKIISTIDYNISGVIPVTDHDSRLRGFLTKGRLLSVLSRQFSPEGSAEERSGVID